MSELCHPPSIHQSPPPTFLFSDETVYPSISVIVGAEAAIRRTQNYPVFSCFGWQARLDRPALINTSLMPLGDDALVMRQCRQIFNPFMSATSKKALPVPLLA